MPIKIRDPYTEVTTNERVENVCKLFQHLPLKLSHEYSNLHPHSKGTLPFSQLNKSSINKQAILCMNIKDMLNNLQRPSASYFFWAFILLFQCTLCLDNSHVKAGNSRVYIRYLITPTAPFSLPHSPNKEKRTKNQPPVFPPQCITTINGPCKATNVRRFQFSLLHRTVAWTI